ncbi:MULTISPECIES: lipoprotein [Planococcus]|uniref:lipoprotein n=1 Tax=Planococcus TaxID=1372 RepID=UPI00115E00F5|nr:lipoprotein [Planococcus soli]
MRKIVVLLVTVLLLAACSEKEYFKQIYIGDMKEYMEEDKDGFLLVVNENDQDFQEYVKNVAEGEKVEIGMYNSYLSEEGAEESNPVLPFDGFDRYNELYYVEDNEVKGNLDLGSYEDMELMEEIEHFVNLHN